MFYWILINVFYIKTFESNYFEFPQKHLKSSKCLNQVCKTRYISINRFKCNRIYKSYILELSYRIVNKLIVIGSIRERYSPRVIIIVYAIRCIRNSIHQVKNKCCVDSSLCNFSFSNSSVESS